MGLKPSLPIPSLPVDDDPATRTETVHHDDRHHVAHGLRIDPDGRRVRFRLPLAPTPDYRLEAGAVSPMTAEATARVVAIVHRIAPWVRLVLVPEVLSEVDLNDVRFRLRDGRRFAPLGGVFFSEHNVVAVSLASSPVGLEMVAAHEAWHAIEPHLSADAVEEIDRQLAPVRFGHGSAYWTDPEERRARAFHSWALRVIEGLPAFGGASTLDQMFAHVWSGEFGRIVLDQKREEAKAAEKSST